MTWYIEKWTDDDLVNALEECDIPITEENITKLRNACLHLFDNKSARNEMICDVADELFG